MDATARRIRIACIDVDDEPDNPAARAALAAALINPPTPTTAPTPGNSLRLRTACTDLYDQPHNRAAQARVLALLCHSSAAP